MRQATCHRCGKADGWVNRATLKGRVVGEFCGDCWPHIHHDPTGGNRDDGSPGPWDDPSPWQENAIRAMEDADN